MPEADLFPILVIYIEKLTVSISCLYFSSKTRHSTLWEIKFKFKTYHVHVLWAHMRQKCLSAECLKCDLFMPPLKMEAYCFATFGRSVGRYVCRSVGMFVCRSVDQVLSGQYLLNPSLDQYQTWCRGCPQWVDDPYWFSGHMCKGQGQTTLLAHCVVRSISFDPFTWLIPLWCRGFAQ